MAKHATKPIETQGFDIRDTPSSEPKGRPSYLGEASASGDGAMMSPVASLQTNIERAYRADAVAHSEIEPLPFLLGLTGMLGVAGASWWALAKLIGLL